MNYTKGEWKLNNIKFGKWLVRAHDGIVAVIEPTGLIQMASCEANAHLIAAAPDLYGACRELRQEFETIWAYGELAGRSHNDPQMTKWAEWSDKLERLLAKAEGK